MAIVQIPDAPTWKKLLGYVGPGFLVSVAYLDPGNLETDLQAGADHKYELLWIVLIGLTFALIIQSRSANLGVVTGKHLSEHCRAEYPEKVNYCLWILAEIAIIAADIPEVIGTAFALNILLKIPIWGGVLLAGLNTFLLLALQNYGIRKLEMAISILIMVVGTCFLGVMVHAKPSARKIAIGMFVPKLEDKATPDAVAMFGALIMPHNLFFHSALVISRKVPQSFDGINSVCKYFLIESGVALFIAFLINVAIVSVTGSVCSKTDLSVENNAHCNNITLESAAFLLKDALGNWSSKLYAVSLLASGQSATVSGTYAGQYVMEGFLDLKMKLWIRNLLTRCIAIVPSLIVSIVGGSSGAGSLIIIASMILTFELPFALIPLLRFTSSKTKMGHHKSSQMVSITSWLLGLCLIGINVYFLGASVMGWMTSNHMSQVSSIFTGVLIFALMIAYMAMLAYLTLKSETAPVGTPRWAAYTVGTSGTELQRGPSATNPKMLEEVDLDDDDIIPI